MRISHPPGVRRRTGARAGARRRWVRENSASRSPASASRTARRAPPPSRTRGCSVRAVMPRKIEASCGRISRSHPQARRTSQLGQVAAIQRDDAGIRGDQPHDDVEAGGLAGPFGPRRPTASRRAQAIEQRRAATGRFCSSCPGCGRPALVLLGHAAPGGPPAPGVGRTAGRIGVIGETTSVQGRTPGRPRSFAPSPGRRGAGQLERISLSAPSRPRMRPAALAFAARSGQETAPPRSPCRPPRNRRSAGYRPGSAGRFFAAQRRDPRLDIVDALVAMGDLAGRGDHDVAARAPLRRISCSPSGPSAIRPSARPPGSGSSSRTGGGDPAIAAGHGELLGFPVFQRVARGHPVSVGVTSLRSPPAITKTALSTS